MFSVGVFLQCNIAFQGSVPSRAALRRRLLAILTADSAFPLAFGCLGEEVTCSNSHSRANRLNKEPNCGPLSVIVWLTMTGKLGLAALNDSVC